MNTKENSIKIIKLFAIIIIALLILLILLSITLNMLLNKSSFETNILSLANKNNDTIFSINNIIFFSGCNAEADISTNTSFLIKNLYQYTDIALFINNNKTEEDLSLKNTLKEAYIDNILVANKPESGSPSLYYKNINDFSAPSFSGNNKLDNKLEFNISSDDETDLNEPTLYNNCANPIVISYVNNNIKTDYSLDSITNTYDGSLLKKCSVTLNSIASAISFDIHLINNLNQEFICPMYIEIPLKSSDDSSSIYDGKLIFKDTQKHDFYRIK